VVQPQHLGHFRQEHTAAARFERAPEARGHTESPRLDPQFQWGQQRAQASRHQRQLSIA